MHGKIKTVFFVILVLNSSIIFSQQQSTFRDSLHEKHVKIPLLFLKTSLVYNLNKLQFGYFDVSTLNYSHLLTKDYNVFYKQGFQNFLYLNYLFGNSKNNLGFWGDILKYVTLTGSVFLAAEHISRYGFLSEPERKKK